MKGLTPPEELLDTQAWNGRTLVKHQLGFLFKCKPAAQVNGAFLSTQIGILILKILCRRRYADTENE